MEEEMVHGFNISSTNVKFIKTITTMMIELMNTYITQSKAGPFFKSFRPHGLWTLYTLFGLRPVNFKMLCLVTLTFIIEGKTELEKSPGFT